jgi:hypothetical protein
VPLESRNRVNPGIGGIGFDPKPAIPDNTVFSTIPEIDPFETHG